MCKPANLMFACSVGPRTTQRPKGLTDVYACIYIHCIQRGFPLTLLHLITEINTNVHKLAPLLSTMLTDQKSMDEIRTYISTDVETKHQCYAFANVSTIPIIGHPCMRGSSSSDDKVNCVLSIGLPRVV